MSGRPTPTALPAAGDPAPAAPVTAGPTPGTGFRLTRGWLAAGAGLLLGLAVLGIAGITPYTADVMFSIVVAAATASSWNISAGYAGDLSLGNGAFYGLGAYASALMLVDLGVTPWVGILVGAVIAGLGALLLGLVTIRLRGPFFAIATLGLVEICGTLSLYFVGLTNGGSGITIQSTPSFWNMSFTDRWQYVLVMLVVLALIVFVSRTIRNSAFGYRLLSFRDNEMAARALGIPPVRARIVALVVSAMLIALVGGVQVQYLQFVSSTSAFSLTFSLQLALVAIVGGVGTVYGPLLGACIVIPIGTLLVPDFTSAGGVQQLVYGVLLVVALLVFRRGALGLIVAGWARVRRAPSAPLPSADIDHEPPPADEEEAVERALAAVGVTAEGTVAGRAGIPAAPTGGPQAAAVPPGDPLLVIDDIAIAFGGLRALDGTSMTVQPGSITAIIGPNGAGKSTLFSVLSGFAVPDSGSVRFEGRELTTMRPEEISRSGLVRTFQTSQLFAQLTVRENVVVGALASSTSLVAAQARADQVLGDLGLTPLADKLSNALSLGDRRRLELGRAMAAGPSLLLLDEILAGLSVQEYEAAIELLLLARRAGVTLLMTEHIMDAIGRMADHVFVLDHGRVIASGTPEQVQNDPQVITAYLGSELKNAYR